MTDSPDDKRHRQYLKDLADTASPTIQTELAARRQAQADAEARGFSLGGRTRMATGMLQQQADARTQVYGSTPPADTNTNAAKADALRKTIASRDSAGEHVSPVQRLSLGYLDADARRDERAAR